MLESLQIGSREALINAKRRAREHLVWGGPGWKVFLHLRGKMERTIRYLEQNPVKIGHPKQEWGFVKRYDGWLPGGHPDAKR